MARIRVVDTAPEVALRTVLEVRGLFHESSIKAPAGKPDIILGKEKSAVFVDGCFWHGCPLHYTRPRTREEFWSAKLITNLERDARISRLLTDAGWNVVRVWEHEIVEDLNRIAGLVEDIVRGKCPPIWPAQRRLRRVVEVAERIEIREFVLLGNPEVVIDAIEGPRVTAKARAKALRPNRLAT